MEDYYPNPDEEFEMLNAENLELLDDMNDDDHGHSTPSKPSSVRRSLHFQDSSGQSQSSNEHSVSRSDPVSSAVASPQELNISSTPQPSNVGRKRTIDEVFGDIDDIVAEEALEKYRKGRKTSCKQPVVHTISSLSPSRTINKEADLIEKIRVMRQRACIESNDGLAQNNLSANTRPSHSNSITRGVPHWPFVSITGDLGQRIYVRIRSEGYISEECGRVLHQKKTIGLLSVPFQSLKDCAMTLLQRKQEEAIDADRQINTSEGVRDDAHVTMTNEIDLWAVKYQPTCYAELLSEESTNRTLLHWLKLWDKVVFNIERKLRKKRKEKESHFTKKPFGPTMNEELDEFGRPYHKMVLLCGPPGLGKTTLALMVAKLAGYNVVEMNASDDRSPEAFQLQLEAATQMKSVMGADPRPNCLVLDEIDGAPAASIETLIKFVHGKDVGKARAKKRGSRGILRRPIICVCNDAYVPALRPLRQNAFVLHFAPTASDRLAARLVTIARNQNFKTDLSAMLALCEKTQNDIRSCLSTLNYLGSLNGCIRLSDVQKSNIGLKDVQRGLFTVWQEIFQMKWKRTFTQAAIPENENNPHDVVDVLENSAQNILRVVQSYGDYDRLALGVFENYPNMKLKDSSLCGLVKGLDWFCTTDIVQAEIQRSQNYIIMPYIAYGFVVWHLLYAGFAWPKINYPSSPYEASVKEAHITQVVREVLKGVSPGVRAACRSAQLVLDVLPILVDIIVPNFRPVSLQLFSPREKQDLCNLVNIMIDYNMTYTQERTPEGTYVCLLDPNIDQAVQFEDFKPTRSLTYGVKQLIAREIELEKMRRYEQIALGPRIDQNVQENVMKQDEGRDQRELPLKQTQISPPSLPNHLQRLKPKAVLKEMQSKDFFGRIVTIPISPSAARAESSEQRKGDVWFHFKEGFNNAVRKTIRISDLL